MSNLPFQYSRIRSARTSLAKFFFKVSLAIVPEGHFLLWADQLQDETWLRIKNALAFDCPYWETRQRS